MTWWLGVDTLTRLRDAGLEMVGSFDFTVEHEWSVESLIGFAHSTSILSRDALGDQAAAFEADVRARFARHASDGTLRQTMRFTYDLARKAA